MIPAAVANHLWQSTLFIGLAWLLTLALKKNHANIRHWIWLIASLKFLLPFSLLVGIGSHLSFPRAPAITQPELSVMEDIGRPFAEPEVSTFTPNESLAPPLTDSRLMTWLIAVGWFIGFAAVVLYGVVRWRRLTALIGKTQPLHEGREIDALRRVQLRRGLPGRVALASFISAIEPGVRGIIHPVLLLPIGIADRLNDEQLESILAHELSHIQRRDNLAAAIHMAVETIFWFHPLIWWVGSRLVDERERACDEEVLRFGSSPEIYAGAILKVCEFYLASPLTLISRVTGSNLKNRIETIMINRCACRLNFAEKVLLIAAGVASISVPVLLGSIGAAPPQTPAAPLAFEAASIKRNEYSAPFDQKLGGQDGRFRGLNITLKDLICYAYGMKNFQVSGGPKWIESERYDVLATTGQASNTQFEFREMLQTLLAERFKVKLHRASKETSGLVMVVAKNGPKFKESTSDERPFQRYVLPSGTLVGTRTSLDRLVSFVSDRLGQPVTDKTGLKGSYDYELSWTPADNEFDPLGQPIPPTNNVAGPSLTTALQEQLGLRLETQKVSMEIIVIDEAERPGENEADLHLSKKSFAGDAPSPALSRMASFITSASATRLLTPTSANPTKAQLPTLAPLKFSEKGEALWARSPADCGQPNRLLNVVRNWE